MNREQSALWQRIQGFEIDDPAASFPFSARLARENGWTRGFALRVVEQYKRFVFLAMVASHEVTPSDEVDEAWHLHLTYTHSYWNGLCRDVLGKSLHHVPTRGGSADAARHHAQYEQTLASYRELFGQAAPADIWPPVDARFGDDVEHLRVSRTRAWIIPKPHLRKRRASPRRGWPQRQFRPCSGASAIRSTCRDRSSCSFMPPSRFLRQSSRSDCGSGCGKTHSRQPTRGRLIRTRWPVSAAGQTGCFTPASRGWSLNKSWKLSKLRRRRSGRSRWEVPPICSGASSARRTSIRNRTRDADCCWSRRRGRRRHSQSREDAGRRRGIGPAVARVVRIRGEFRTGILVANAVDGQRLVAGAAEVGRRYRARSSGGISRHVARRNVGCDVFLGEATVPHS